MNGDGRASGQAGAGSAPSALPAPVPVKADTAARREPHVLVVDDHALNRYLVGAALGRLRWRVAQAGDGRQALEMIRAGERYDLVLMDLDMPVLDGLAATRRIRAWEQQAQRPPLTIIALTANFDRNAERLCREAGMSGFLAKPVDTIALPQLLMEKLRASRRD